MTIELLLENFYSDLLAVNRRLERTAETYTESCRIFLNWLKDQQVKLSAVDTQTLLFFLIWRKDKGATELTIAKDISALRSFGSYLVRKEYWVENVADLIDRPKKHRNLPKVLSIDEVEKFLASIDISTPLGVRDRALFELIYSCGLRISEACTLKISSLHLNERILIVKGKGDKERMVPFGEEAKFRLSDYLNNVRPQLVGSRQVAEVFVNYKGEPISRKGVWKNFKAYVALSGVSAKVHTLRHSFATHLLSGGADLRTVQELLGHSDLETTTIYTHIENKQLESAHEKYFVRTIPSEVAESFLDMGGKV